MSRPRLQPLRAGEGTTVLIHVTWHYINLLGPMLIQDTNTFVRPVFSGFAVCFTLSGGKGGQSKNPARNTLPHCGVMQEHLTSTSTIPLAFNTKASYPEDQNKNQPCSRNHLPESRSIASQPEQLPLVAFTKYDHRNLLEPSTIQDSIV